MRVGVGTKKGSLHPKRSLSHSCLDAPDRGSSCFCTFRFTASSFLRSSSGLRGSSQGGMSVGAGIGRRAANSDPGRRAFCIWTCPEHFPLEPALQKGPRIVRYSLDGDRFWPFFGEQYFCNSLKLNGAPDRIRTCDLWFRRPGSLPYQIVTTANNNRHFGPVFTGRPLPTITNRCQPKWEENGRTFGSIELVWNALRALTDKN